RFLEDAAYRIVDCLTRRPRAQLLFASRHRGDAEIKQMPLVRRRFSADDQRVCEIAAIALQDHGEIENEHIARQEHAFRRRAAVPLGTWRDSKVAINDHWPSGRLQTSAKDT